MATLMISSITPTVTPTGALLAGGDDVDIANVEATRVKNITMKQFSN